MIRYGLKESTMMKQGCKQCLWGSMPKPVTSLVVEQTKPEAKMPAGRPRMPRVNHPLRRRNAESSLSLVEDADVKGSGSKISPESRRIAQTE